MPKLLTKKDVKQLIDAQTKQLNKRIDPIEELLRQNTAILKQTTETQRQTTATLRRTTALLTHLVQGVDELKTDMKQIKTTVTSHTTTLDFIYKNTETSNAETAALRATIKRHEQWFSQIASKVRVKLEGLETNAN